MTQSNTQLREAISKLYTEYWHTDISGQEFQQKILDLVTTAASSSHEHTEACQNATEVKRQLLTNLMEQKRAEIIDDPRQPDGKTVIWTVPVSVIQNLLGGEK